MNASLQHLAQRAMQGDAGLNLSLLRAAMSIAEPFYSAAVSLRNLRYDLSGGYRLPRPVISVGNITTGGTGKTPVVRWLAESLRERNIHPAILMRGYRAHSTVGATLVSPSAAWARQVSPLQSDEQLMLDRQLNQKTALAIPVIANPNRRQAAQEFLSRDPALAAFILDDGFQHRQLARDFDLVLIDATRPFGYNHVLPRGLLREPLYNLRRANAFLITRADQVSAERLASISQLLTYHNRAAVIYRADHRIAGLPAGRLFAFAGIGNPQSLQSQLSGSAIAFVGAGSSRPSSAAFAAEKGGETSSLQTTLVGSRWFPDHHQYTIEEIHSLQSQARKLGAAALVTTEKDHIKIVGFPQSKSDFLPIIPLQLQIQFHNEDQSGLLNQILTVLAQQDVSSGKPSAAPACDTSTR